MARVVDCGYNLARPPACRTPHAHMPTQLQDMPDSPEAYLDGDTLYSNNLSDAMADLNNMGITVDFQVRGRSDA